MDIAQVESFDSSFQMASDIRSLYPFLTNEDLEDYKNNPDKFKSINEVRENDFYKKIANFSLSENKSIVANRPKSTAKDELCKDELRIVIIGKTGQGKSATANLLLGKVRCEEGFTATSVTRESRCFTELVYGRKISVMDTPGLQDTHKSNDSILKELARMTTLFPDGVHAFLYVMNLADPRFTAEDKKVLDLIEKTFGGGFKSYCLLVFSHGDSALKKINLDTYKRKQMEIGQETSGNRIQQYFRTDQRGPDHDQKSLANLLYELSWKMLAVDNATSVPLEKAHYREQIVAMVDRMRTSNRPENYTNGMFVKAQQEKEAMRQKGLTKGWDPSILSKVETILAANPSISREELNAEVIRQLQEEEKERIRKEKRERQEHREREERDWQLRQEQRRDEWEKLEREEKEEYKKRQKLQQKMWEDQVREIEDEHRSLLEKAISVIVSVAKKGVGWVFNSLF